MRIRPYGAEPPRSRFAEFFENFVCGFLAFTTCIGGWLVHFGMDAGWMLDLSVVIATAFAWMMIRR